MYTIMGSDGKPYGPVPKEQVQQWITDGRANAQTRMLAEGETEWRPLGQFAEFAAPPPMTAVRPGPDRAGAPPETDGRAIGSLVCGILSVTIFFCLAGIPAIILGHTSRANIRKSMGRLKGEGMALAGLIMGYVSLAAIPIILIIATIALPNLFRRPNHSNESAAVASLRAISTAELSYLSTTGGGASGTLEQLVSSGLLDSRFITNSGIVSGYAFSITVDGAEYTAEAIPATPSTGRYGYFINRDGVVHWSTMPSLAPSAAHAGMPVQ